MTLRRVCIITVVVEKELSISYSELQPVALLMQHAQRMRGIILSSMAARNYNTFSSLRHEGFDYQKKLLNTKYVLQSLCSCDRAS